MEPDYRYQNRQQNFQQAPAPIQQPVEVKKKKGCPIAVVIICLILAIGGVGFGIFEMLTVKNIEHQSEIKCADSTEKPKTDDEQKENKEEESKAPHSEQSELFSNIKNEKYDRIYRKIIGVSYIDETAETYKETTYNLWCTTDGCSINKDYEEIAKITGLTGQIKDYFYGRFGQAYGQETLFLIMDDGSVEYLPMHEAFKNNNFASRGKLDDLKDIIKIHQVSGASKEGGDGGADVLAEDKDGNYYNLYYMLYE